MQKKKVDGLTILVIVLAVLVMITGMLVIAVRVVFPAVRGPVRDAVIERELRLGRRYLSEMEYDKAVAAFSRVVEIDDRNTEGYEGLGDAYTGLEDWKPAVQNYDRAVITVTGSLPEDGASEEEVRVMIAEAETAEAADDGGETGEEAGRKSGRPYDTGYVMLVIARRDAAIENGLLDLVQNGSDSAGLEAWLEELGHPAYTPKDEALKKLLREESTGLSPEAVTAMFQEQIRRLADQYGVLWTGKDRFEIYTGTEYASFDIPDAVVEKDRGLLFADLYDYDGDGAQELLTFRRETLDTDVSTLGAGGRSGRSGFYAEIYEAAADGCVLADTAQVCVHDTLYFAFGSTSMEVFRTGDGDGTSIFFEAYVTEQDHSEDVSLWRLRYRDGQFSDPDGARYGCWYDEDSFGIYFVPESEEAALHMSGRDWRDSGWTIASRPYNNEHEETDRAYREGLSGLGLTLLQRRQDYAPAADAFYRPAEGTMTRLGKLTTTMQTDLSRFEEGIESFGRMREDCAASLDAFRGQAPEETSGPEPAAAGGQGETAADSQQSGPREDREMSMAEAGIPYGHFSGIKPQGDGALPVDLDLYENGTFRLHSVVPLFDRNDPEDSNYEYTYSGTYRVLQRRSDGAAVVNFSCDAADFQMTWDGRSLDHEDFYAAPGND